MRLLYLGDPDALGENPVIGLDHDDEPVGRGRRRRGFDLWHADPRFRRPPAERKLASGRAADHRGDRGLGRGPLDGVRCAAAHHDQPAAVACEPDDGGVVLVGLDGLIS